MEKLFIRGEVIKDSNYDDLKFEKGKVIKGNSYVFAISGVTMNKAVTFNDSIKLRLRNIISAFILLNDGLTFKKDHLIDFVNTHFHGAQFNCERIMIQEFPCETKLTHLDAKEINSNNALTRSATITENGAEVRTQKELGI